MRIEAVKHESPQRYIEEALKNSGLLFSPLKNYESNVLIPILNDEDFEGIPPILFSLYRQLLNKFKENIVREENNYLVLDFNKLFNSFRQNCTYIIKEREAGRLHYIDVFDLQKEESVNIYFPYYEDQIKFGLHICKSGWITFDRAKFVEEFDGYFEDVRKETMKIIREKGNFYKYFNSTHQNETDSVNNNESVYIEFSWYEPFTEEEEIKLIVHTEKNNSSSYLSLKIEMDNFVNRIKTFSSFSVFPLIEMEVINKKRYE
jgi:hypothetical protein